MKKKTLSNLKLNKAKIADLNKIHGISGGGTIESCIICEQPTPTDNNCDTNDCPTTGSGGSDSIVYCPTINCTILYC